MNKILPIVAGAMLLAIPATAMAGMDAKQVAIAAKALNFLTAKPASGAKVVVVAGAADVGDVQSALPNLSVAAGGADQAAGAFAVFVDTAADAQKAKGKGVVTVGSQLACVEAGACVIAVETQPKVSIYVSKAAAAAAGIDFDPNFKMMITEK